MQLTLSDPKTGARATSNRKAKLTSRLAIVSLGGRGITHLERMCIFQSQSDSPALFAPRTPPAAHGEAPKKPKDSPLRPYYQSARDTPTARRAVASVLCDSIAHVITLVSEEGVLPSPGYERKDYTGVRRQYLCCAYADTATRRSPSHVTVDIGGHNRYCAFQPHAMVQDVMLLTLKLS